MTEKDMEQIQFGAVAPEKSLDDSITARDIAGLIGGGCYSKSRQYFLSIKMVLNKLPDADSRLQRFADRLCAFATVSDLVDGMLSERELEELRRTWRHAVDIVYYYGPNTAKVLLAVL